MSSKNRKKSNNANENSQEHKEEIKLTPTKLSNANDAIDFVKNGGFNLEGREVVWATSDCNVFYEMSQAVTHGTKNKHEIFRIEL